MKMFELASLRAEPSDPRNFTGNGSLTRITGITTNPDINTYRVSFEARARTNWHLHTGPQILLVVEGTCRFQTAGAPVREAGPGDTVCFEPGERHWHGAAPAGPMTHIAININATTDWFEPVTDAQFGG